MKKQQYMSLIIKGPGYKDIAVLGQFYAEIIT